MSDGADMVDHMDYAELTQNALRGVIRKALERAAMPDGLPGEHHFYISFLTRAKGVVIPPDVLAKYPNEITIVLQHQYRDLKVFETFFNVTLSFGGIPRVLKVPYEAIVRFHDPSVQFVLDFELDQGFDEDEDDEAHEDGAHDAGVILDQADGTKAPEPDTADSGPKVVSLEQFRKK